MPPLPLEIPPAFAQAMRTLRGDEGSAWLRALPMVVAELAARWGITVGAPFALSFNYVAPARRTDGSEAVFKIGLWGDELVQEIAALRQYGGDGCCRLLETDIHQGAMLLERLRPGTMLAAVAERDDDTATRIAAGLMWRLWRPLPEPPRSLGLRPLAAWFRAFARHRAEYAGPGPFPDDILARAEALGRELLASAPREVLLHADFHHTNILSSAERGPWLSIDPKGMVGDPGYEVGPFVLNPEPEGPPKSSKLLGRRLDILADELAYDRARLRDWAFVYAVLSACWSAENDGDGWQSAIGSAENLLRA
jgi:streptomycin 6-kinase